VAFVGAAVIMARAAFVVVVVIRKPKQPAARRRSEWREGLYYKSSKSHVHDLYLN
jgi:hypothetical protein